jgi:protein associated with RNAse G/E
MNYSPEIMKIVETQMDQLIQMMKDGEDPFNQACIDRYYGMYLDMIKDED